MVIQCGPGLSEEGGGNAPNMGPLAGEGGAAYAPPCTTSQGTMNWGGAKKKMKKSL